MVGDVCGGPVDPQVHGHVEEETEGKPGAVVHTLNILDTLGVTEHCNIRVDIPQPYSLDVFLSHSKVEMSTIGVKYN